MIAVIEQVLFKKQAAVESIITVRYTKRRIVNRIAANEDILIEPWINHVWIVAELLQQSMTHLNNIINKLIINT